MLCLHSFENPIHGKESQGQFPAGGTFSWRHCKARSVHFISCSFTDSVVPPLSCSGSGSSLSGIATSSYGSLSSRQASSIKSKILPSRCTSLSIFLQLWSRQFRKPLPFLNSIHLSEFEASLVNKTSSRTARNVTQRNPTERASASSRPRPPAGSRDSRRSNTPYVVAKTKEIWRWRLCWKEYKIGGIVGDF